MPVDPVILHLTSDSPDLDTWLARAETIHRMLRLHLSADYSATIRQILNEGAEIAIRHNTETVRALAVFRCYHNTYEGYRFYIDDLITDDTSRSEGHGGALLQWCEALARERGCAYLTLDSGVQRQRAHRFYFREGMAITAFNFQKPL